MHDDVLKVFNNSMEVITNHKGLCPVGYCPFTLEFTLLCSLKLPYICLLYVQFCWFPFVYSLMVVYTVVNFR